MSESEIRKLKENIQKKANTELLLKQEKKDLKEEKKELDEWYTRYLEINPDK